MEDKRYAAEQERLENGCRVKVVLKPYESAFIVFGEDAEEKMTDWDEGCVQKIPLSAEGWKISVRSYGCGEAFTPISLQNLVNISDPRQMPKFSGTIRYEKEFRGTTGKKVLISLGEVYETATVFLNGVLVGEKICPPYCLEADGSMIKDGENILTVEITNTLAKAQHHNQFDRYWVQDPSGLLGPVMILVK